MSEKEKLLASAQKFLAKGQLPRAVKDYQRVVELDPKDIRNRQKLAELYSRARMLPEALDAFEAVARHYDASGFYLKAIAVYKQMQRLDPTKGAIYRRLAELNVKQGLIGNALAEYRSLIGLYEKNGSSEEVVQVLRKMKDLEPENLNIRVKFIETLLQGGAKTEARADLEEILSLLNLKRDDVRMLRLLEHFLPQFPDDLEFQTTMARVLIRKGEVGRGIALLEKLLKKHAEDTGLLRLLAEGFRKSEAFGQEAEAYSRLLRLRPDDLGLRAGRTRALLDQRSFSGALEELEPWKEAFLDSRYSGELKDFYERLKKEMPSDERICASLQTIYSATGEGGKLFDTMASSPAKGSLNDVSSPESCEETFTDCVLQDAVGDLEETASDRALPALLEDGAEEIPLEFLEEIGREEPTAVAAPPASGAGVQELELDLEFELEDEGKASAPVSATPTASGDDFFDLRGAILEEPESEAAPAEEEVDELFENTFLPPKKEIKTDIDVEDPDSHYNLGIAYKEMGLLDDAVKEFDKAMKEPSLVVSCLTLKGICLGEKRAFARAESVFKEALTAHSLADAERMGLHYELGLLYESWGRAREAHESFKAVASVDPFFRSAGEKVRLLAGELGLADGADEGKGKKSRVSFV